jgi:hypothetical protein
MDMAISPVAVGGLTMTVMMDRSAELADVALVLGVEGVSAVSHMAAIPKWAQRQTSDEERLSCAG